MEMTDAQVLADIRERLNAAENAGDPEPICAAMADDVVLMAPSVPVQEGKAASSSFVRDVLPSLLVEFERRITYTSAEVRIVGDMGFDRGTFSFSVAPRTGGPTEVSTGKYFWMYARSGDTWKLTRVIVCLDENAAEDQSGSKERTA